MKTTLIYNAWIIDGTNTPPYRGALVIGKHGRILYVGTDTLNPTQFDCAVDAHENYLCPGFINTHAHSDVSIFTAPEAPESLAQGITTEICGNCGISPFPVTSKNRAALEKRYARYNVKMDWSDFSTYAAKIRELHPGVNIVSLLGHNTLRAAVMGYENKAATENHIASMKMMLRDNLDQGAAGVSLGLLYIPGKFTTQDELCATLAPLGDAQKVITAHLRSEGDSLLESLQEFYEIARAAAIPRCHVSHAKTALPHNWGKIDDFVTQLSRTDLPFEISADRYPYLEGVTSLSIILPPPLGNLVDSEIQKALQSPETFQETYETLKTFSKWDGIRLVDTQIPEYLPYLGEMMPEIAPKTGKSCAQITVEILRADSVNAMAAFGGLSHENMVKILNLRNVTCGTDENIKPTDYSLGRSHPRGWGSIPRFFNILKPTLPIETIVYKLTALPARIYGLKSRGMLIDGNVADLVLFDPENFNDHATFKEPHQFATGIKRVWIDGKLAWHDERPILSRYGTLVVPDINPSHG